MVKHSDEVLDKAFAALADPTRRAILARLAKGEQSVTELAKPFAISLPAVSKHLRVLERAGLLSRTQEGRVHHLRLEAKPMKEVAAWLNHYRMFWESQLDNLAAFFEQLPNSPESEPPNKKDKNQ